MASRSATRRARSRRRLPRRWMADLEPLERRDCPASVVMAAAPASVPEAGGTATFTVGLTERVTKPVTVNYYLGGTATFSADYRLTLGGRSIMPTGTLSFAPGETSKAITVTAVNDGLREGNESIAFNLLGARNATLGTRSATITLQDDDNYTASIVQRTPAMPGSLARFTLQLSSPATRTETFSVSTTDGTAVAGTDYQALTQAPLVILPGQTSKDFWVPVPATATVGNVFILAVEAVTSGFPAVMPVGVLIGGGITPAPVSISVVGATTVEGNSGTRQVLFPVILAAPSTVPVTVNYATADGTATVADNDYVATTGTLTFAPGEFRKSVSVTVVGDRFLESDETFSLQLSGASAGIPVLRSTGSCTIRNDEVNAPGYQIDVTYGTPNLSDAQKSVFERAVTRIQQIIVGDLPSVTLPDRTFIDDMRITAYVEPMDPNLNGYATATAWRTGAAGLAYEGEIHISASKIGNPGIYYTTIHEMLHALGFYDDFFTATNTVSGLGTTAPLFTGANAVREFRTYFGRPSATGVPLYGVLAAMGSYGSHWDTDTIGTEIMSVGWDTTRTDVRPFSRMTIGLLDDIGYDVNYAAADPYVRPSDVATAQLATATRVVTSPTSFKVEFSVPAASIRASQVVVQPRPTVVVVQPAAIPVVTVAPMTAAKSVSMAAVTAMPPTAMMPRAGGTLTLLSQHRQFAG